MADLHASVIIPCRNDAVRLTRQLDCLAAQTFQGFEVIVTDNGGTPSLVDDLARWRPALDVRVIDATARIGCGPARNVGVMHARSDRLLFCDADDLVCNGWVEALVEALESWDFVTGPKAMITEEDLVAVGAQQLFATRAFSVGPNDAGARPFASGNNAAYRRAVLDAIGGFGSHNLRREDVEASWLALDRGFRLGFVPEARILYVGRTSARARFWQSFGYAVGFEALRRQLDPDHTFMAPLSSSAKVAVARSFRSPADLPPNLGGLVGQLTERLVPGRYFERVRRRARFGTQIAGDHASRVFAPDGAGKAR